ARFGRASAPPGLDFAAYSCDSPTGTCDVPTPPSAAGPLPTECPDGSGTCHPTAPRHGLCEPTLAGAWGTTFRGMHHHSQFRCALVEDESTEPYALRLSDLGE